MPPITDTAYWREVSRNYTQKRYYKRKRWIDKYKIAKGCEHCGYNQHAEALDFDHIDPATKLFLIPRNINCNLKKLIAEMRKCRILCANCHRVHSRKQWNNGTTYKPNPRKSDVQVQP